MSEHQERDAIEVVLDRLFTYHPPTGDQPARYQRIGAAVRALGRAICEETPVGLERVEALTRLREVRMWANAAIACAPMAVAGGSHGAAEGEAVRDTGEGDTVLHATGVHPDQVRAPLPLGAEQERARVLGDVARSEVPGVRAALLEAAGVLRDVVARDQAENPLAGLAPGRIVHVVMAGEGGIPCLRPAIVVLVYPGDEGACRVQVFGDGRSYGQTAPALWQDVVYSADMMRVQTWRWPAKR